MSLRNKLQENNFRLKLNEVCIFFNGNADYFTYVVIIFIIITYIYRKFQAPLLIKYLL